MVAKAPKRRRGKDLSLLVTMPLDILFEVREARVVPQTGMLISYCPQILSQLSPKDLLSVTQTNKLFYKTLLSPNAKSVWIAARAPLGVPEPPDDFTEARWAGLLFKSNCQVSMSCSFNLCILTNHDYRQSCSSKNVKIDWMLRRRACVSCKKRQCVN